jgi:DNA-directed RNA polymerase subunit RPC12/RpoP
MQWKYRKVEVYGDELIDIPAGSKCIQIRPISRKDASFVEWLEPVREELAPLRYPTLDHSLKEIEDHTYTCANCKEQFVDTADRFPIPVFCPRCEQQRGNV